MYLSPGLSFSSSASLCLLLVFLDRCSPSLSFFWCLHYSFGSSFGFGPACVCQFCCLHSGQQLCYLQWLCGAAFNRSGATSLSAVVKIFTGACLISFLYWRWISIVVEFVIKNKQSAVYHFTSDASIFGKWRNVRKPTFTSRRWA